MNKKRWIYPSPNVSAGFTTNKGYEMRVVLFANSITTLHKTEPELVNYFSRYDLEFMLNIISDLFTKETLNEIKQMVDDYSDTIWNIKKTNEQLTLF